MTRALRVGLWALHVVVALAFLAAGSAKLTAAPAMVQMFDTIGFGQGFRYLTGAIEVSCAVLLLVPLTASVAAIALMCTMAGAILAHLTLLDSSPLGPVILLLLCAAIGWARKDALAA